MPNLFILYGTLFYNKSQKIQFCLPEKRLCFRFVTRGDFPILVKENVEELESLLGKFKLTNYIIEVVCNKSIGLVGREQVRELVVPVDYTTPNGTKFKARNLHYAMEDEINLLADDDWIVHLDEESKLTKDAIIGIANFINTSKHQIGQGMITYGKARVTNLTNTLAECYRCAVYIGASRFCFKVIYFKEFF